MIEAEWLATVSGRASFRRRGSTTVWMTSGVCRDVTPPRPCDRLLAPPNGEGDRSALPPWGLPVVAQRSRGLGLETDARPSLDEVLDLRRARMDEVEHTIAALTPRSWSVFAFPRMRPVIRTVSTRPGMHPRDPQ